MTKKLCDQTLTDHLATEKIIETNVKEKQTEYSTY